MNAHPFTLRQLQYAVAVADTGHFRRAAERCRVSQPSLSAQLAQLESVLGVRLFERDRRRVLLTPAGARLVVRARRTLTEADDLGLAARQLQDPLAGTLRIGVIPTVAPYLLPRIAPGIRARYPRLTVQWTEERTGPILRELQQGRLDAALLAETGDLADLEREVVGQDEFVLAGPRGHPLCRPPSPASLAEMRGQCVLLLDDGHCFRDQALALCTDSGARESDFRGTSLSTLALMVAAGAGLTLLPALAVPVENRSGTLAIRRFAPPAPARTLVLAWRATSPAAGGLRQLAAAMRTAAAARPSVRRTGRARRRS
jgi:LysR family hydrogen peroxide-inducible transcriptional activator